MTSTTSTALEQALQRHGDDLYRLALLLTPNDNDAAAALRSALPRLRDTPPAALDELAMIAAMAAALPAERRRIRRRLPSWARLSADREAAPLLAALSQLPRQQRLVLGLTLLRGFDAAQAAQTLGIGEAQIRDQARDALLALAPAAQPGLALDDLAAERAQEDCRPTRALLALGGDQAHADPSARGHLALCSACRAAEQTWQRLTTTVEQALRGALREITLPEHLFAELRAVSAEAAQQPTPSRLLAGQRGRLALVAFAVVALIALLVLPGRRAPAPASTGAAAGAPAALAPRELAAGALDQLYAPPTGTGVWHGHWEIRWSFVGGSYATLDAEAWIDSGSGRHRVQLVHADGGGPFEFELADEAGKLWYATTPSYAPSLYPTLPESTLLRTQLQVSADDAPQLLRARLASGAWDLASTYLRQAQAAPELRSWGRQRSPDGAALEIISFDGFSPLAPPADTPDAIDVPTTILLMIDVESGALREVRELAGPEGGERSSRTTWRFVAGELLTETQDIERAFDLRRAWNGAGDFSNLGAGYADPALPLLPAQQVLSLASAIQPLGAPWLLAKPPPGAERAVLLASGDDASVTAVYLGVGRRLAIRTLFGSDDAEVELDPIGGEAISLSGQLLVLHPTNGLGHQARLSYRGPFNQQIQVAIGAIGYTRAELLDLLRGFAPPTAESYRAQARLFTDPQASDPAAFDALLGALATPPPPPDGTVRHFVERTFTRHTPARDPFGDPYHLPFYGGRPEELLIENWGRVQNGVVEMAATEHDADGTIYGRQYLGPADVLYYDATISEARLLDPRDLALVNRINLDQAIVLELLVRGNSQLVTLADGTRAVSSSQPLLDTRFFNALNQQQSQPDAGGSYVADLLNDTPITTQIVLGEDGRPRRIESWAEAGGRDRVLLEAWELLSDEQVSAEHIPTATFSADPYAMFGADLPQLLTIQDSREPSLPTQPDSAPSTVTITEALRLVRAPLWLLPPDPAIAPPLVEVGNLGNRPLEMWDNVFETALQRRMAIRLTYWLPANGPLTRQTLIYQGDVETFGAYLRTQPAWRGSWQNSEPVRVTIGEHEVDGWRITEAGGTVWTLCEVDGKLLAMQTTYEEQSAALARLQPFGRP